VFGGQLRFLARFARIDGASGTPVFAYLVVLALGAGLVLAFAVGRTSGTDTFAACGAIAVLALVLIYGAVQVAALRLFAGQWGIARRAIPVIALVSLGATFIANVVPVPSGAAALYPYLVLAWLAVGIFALRKTEGGSP
jgi:hypothetical protein